MAKGNNPWINNLQGSSAEMTLVKAKDGDMIMKGKIQQMTNPNSAEQQKVRNPFRWFSKAGSALNPFLRQFVDPANVMRSPFNQFVSQSLKSQLEDSDSDESPEQMLSNASLYMQPTRGGLYNPNPFANDPSAVSNIDVDGNQVGVSWAYDSGSVLQDGTDEVRVLSFNDETYDWSTLDTGNSRDELSTNVTVAKPTTGRNLYFVFLVSATTGETHKSTALFYVESNGDVTYSSDFFV